MIKPSTFKFLQLLSKNNNREWFQQHRDEYLNARDDFEQFCTALLNELIKFDRSLENLEAKQSIFRLYRDVRFSKNKLPYKDHFGAYFNPGGKKVNTPGYYIQVQPGKSFLAGGLYHPEPAHLSAVRQEIDYNFAEWTNLLKDKNFRKVFPAGIDQEHKLTRRPKGYEDDNPAIETLKLKSFTFSSPLADDELLKKNAPQKIAARFGALTPAIRFLGRAHED